MEKKKKYNANNNYGNRSNNNTLNNNRKRTKSNEKFNNKTMPTPMDEQVEEISSAISTILEELKKIQDNQIEFRQMLTNLKQTAGNNYLNLNERLRTLEKNYIKINNRNVQYANYRDNYNENKSYRDYKDKPRPILISNKHEENLKIENLKNKFANGKYNEALIESKENDKYLFKLLPLMEKSIIPKIEIAILEDAISRLNKRIRIVCFEEGRERINDILQFYIQLIKSKIELKVITQINIKDALTFLKSKANNKLNEDDIHNIERVIGSLRI